MRALLCAAVMLFIIVIAADVVDPWIAGYLGGVLVGGIAALAASA